MDLLQIAAELKRRRVVRVVIGYGLAAFAVLQVVEPVAHGLHLPDWTLSVAVAALALGFPVAVGLAWAFDLTSSGLVRTPPAEPPAAPGGEARPGEPGAAAPGDRPAPPASVAVLPFSDLSPARDQDHFCDGIAEELLGALSSLPGLRVAARSSSFQFKGRAADGREIGRALGVATLLEGSVRKAGDRVRVTARLASAADGYQLWSETFDRRLEDIFAVQEEIARAVVRALEVRLGPGSGERLRFRGTTDVQAYEMYLKGRQFLMSVSDTGHRFARQLFRGAIERDPRFAQAWAGLADTLFIHLQWHLDEAHAEPLRAEALHASDEALRLDPGAAEAHVARANILSLLGRGAEAEAHFQRALELHPGLADARYFLARHLFAAGRLAEAAAAFEETARVDPDHYQALCLLPPILRGLGQEARSADAARRALAAVERRLRLAPDDARALYLGGGVHLQYGDRARGEAWLLRSMELAPDDFATQYNAACAFAGVGQVDRALDALERAVGTGRGFRRWLEHDADLDPLRGLPRFGEIMARVRG